MKKGILRLLRPIFIAICAYSLAPHFPAAAASFGIDGIAIPPIYIPGGNSAPSAVLRQADGKLIVAGTADGPIARTMFAARFTTTGSLDTSYGTGGVAFVPVPEDADELQANAATLDAQGNLVLAGYVNYPYPYSKKYMAVARLTPDGNPDAAFGATGFTEIKLSDWGYATTVTTDSLGRVVVAGSGFTVVRLDASGSNDPSFNGTGFKAISSSPYAMDASSVAIDANGNIVLSGISDITSGTPVAVARLTESGQFDPSFNGTGTIQLALGNYSAPFPLALDSSGRILVAGESSDGYHQTFLVTRLTGTGTVDASFGSAGLAQFEPFYPPINALLASMRLDSLDRIVLLANASFGMYALRLTAGGSVDASFNGTGIAQAFSQNGLNGPGSMAIDGNDNVIVAGSQSPDAIVARLTSTGSLDSTFNGNGIVVQSCGVKQLIARGIIRQPDGKLVVAGAIGSVPDPSVDFVVARLTLEGVLDSSFNGSGYRVIDVSSGGPDTAYAIALDKNNNIVVAGQAGSGDIAVAKLTPEGALDTGFNGIGTRVVTGTALYHGGARSVAIDATNNIVVVGQVPIGNKTGFGVVRLTPTGALDTTFASTGSIAIPVGTYGDNQPTGVGIDSFGRIAVGGWFQDLSSCGQLVALRLTQAGALDASFAGTGIKVVSPAQGCFAIADAFALDASDRITLGGFRTVARLTAAGALDPTFNGTGIVTLPEDSTPIIYAIAIDNGKTILVGDAIFAANEIRVARLAPDGTLDPTLNFGRPVTISAFPGALGNHAYALALDGTGQTYVAGTAGRAIAVVKLFGGAAMALSLVSINGGASLIANTPFDVLVQAMDDFGSPQPVTTNTMVTLSRTAGYGELGGNVSCIIPAGSMMCTISGATYSIAYQGVVLTASATSGDPLDPVDSGLLTVNYATTTTQLASSPNPSVVGQAVTFTATVTGANPTGTVTFTVDSGYAQCPWPTLSGSGNTKTGSCTVSDLPAGTHSIRATYTGDYANAVSYSPIILQVVNFGPSKNVALASNGAVASASSTYSAAFPVSAINDGDRAGLNFGAGGVWKDATKTLPDWVEIGFNGAQTIDHVIVYSVQDNSTNPVQPTSGMTFTQRGVTAFDVQAWNGSAWSTLASVTGNNLVQRTVSFTATQTSKIRVVINGSPSTYSFLAEVEAWTATTAPPPPNAVTLVSSANPSRMGKSVTFTVTVKGITPTGTVAFTANGAGIANCGAVPLSNSGNSGTAACTTSFVSKGTYAIVATYSGDANNPASSSASLSEVIKKR
jgi:uncharacterized delta-60 repeat protein